MVLNNISHDCELLSNLFNDLNQFTTLLEKYKTEVIYNYSNIISNLSKNEVSHENDILYSNIIYSLAKKITNCSFQVAEIMTNFSHLHLCSDTLNKQLKNFFDYTKEFIIMCTNFSSHENSDHSKITYANDLHIKFEETYNYYITLYLNVSFFKSIATELYNEIPEQIQNNPDYTELTIQSNKETSDLQTMSKDIELISNLIINIQALLPEDMPKDYYIQKVESGSIFFSFVAAVPLFKQIVATIDYCATVYYKYRNNHIDLKMKENELAKKQILTNYLEQILNIEINGENLEQAEKSINMVMKYLDSNPSIKLNDKEYNVQNQTSLLTDTILQNTVSNEPNNSND